MPLNKFLHWTDHYSKGINLYHVVILSILFAILSISNHHGGVLHPEMSVRFPFNLSDKPLLNKLFDSNILDDGFYRARELSYLLDFLDSKFVEFSIEYGFPHILSLTHYLFSIAFGYLVWLFCVKEIKLHPLLGAGFLALFWPSPSVFLGGDVFRTVKIAVTLLTALLIYVVYKAFVNSKNGKDFQISGTDWILYSIAILTMSFLDEQVFFLNISMLMFLTLWGLVVRHRNIYFLVLIGIAGVLLHEIYRNILAPQLIHHLNRYWPNFSFQTLLIQLLFRYLVPYLVLGVLLYLETFRFLIGNPPQFIGAILLFVFISFPIFYVNIISEKSDDRRKFFSLAFLGLLITHLIMVITMNILMVLRPPALTWPEVRLVYYWLPTSIMFTMALPILANIFIRAKIPKWLILSTVILAVIVNTSALLRDKEILIHGHFDKYYESSSSLLMDLKKIGIPDHQPSLTSIYNLVYQHFLYIRNLSEDDYIPSTGLAQKNNLLDRIIDLNLKGKRTINRAINGLGVDL